MYEDLLLALQCVQKYEKDPFVNMFSTTKMAGDCADAILELNVQLARVSRERDRYRDDGITLSLLLLCGAGRRERLTEPGKGLKDPLR